LSELVVEDLRQARVSALRHSRRVGDRGAFLGIEVDQEMLGLENLPAKDVVLDLILAEVVLSVGAPGRGHTDGREEGERPRNAPPRAARCYAPLGCAVSRGTGTASAHKRSS